MHTLIGLSPQVKYFTEGSKAVLLLWIIYVVSVLYLLCFCARLFIDPFWSPTMTNLLSLASWNGDIGIQRSP